MHFYRASLKHMHGSIDGHGIFVFSIRGKYSSYRVTQISESVLESFSENAQLPVANHSVVDSKARNLYSVSCMHQSAEVLIEAGKEREKGLVGRREREGAGCRSRVQAAPTPETFPTVFGVQRG